MTKSIKRFAAWGRHTYGVDYCDFRSWGEGYKLCVGNFCSFARNVKVFLGGNHRTEWAVMYPFPALKEQWPKAASVRGPSSLGKGDIRVGHGVWVGEGAILMSGSVIGNGAVIGAGAVVSGVVEPYGVAVGNPASVVRLRLSPEHRGKLEEMQWWEWPDDLINDMVVYLCSSDVDRLYDEWRARR